MQEKANSAAKAKSNAETGANYCQKYLKVVKITRNHMDVSKWAKVKLINDEQIILDFQLLFFCVCRNEIKFH